MVNTKKKVWTTTQLLNLSKSLASAYNLGADTPEAQTNSDAWSTEKFADLGKDLSRSFLM
ncbi:MAG TPA: hypothetical protein IGS53_27650 [Leptolyngbyaceae cyanobacterium M33_DOE_097]|uniref:Uncharacterized protein n=1 Tax=Oscillatoriales cyanobacterium SpSt-418 TaxID=2282169 RepID=A0A7C3PGC3_9CYAN|nr:hypothetical protein [Leptolyngbyaceae cyanobacterium M33_DOE_097]